MATIASYIGFTFDARLFLIGILRLTATLQNRLVLGLARQFPLFVLQVRRQLTASPIMGDKIKIFQ